VQSSGALVHPNERSHLRGKPVFWSRSYCLVSAGGAPLEIIKRYIQDQGCGA